MNQIKKETPGTVIARLMAQRDISPFRMSQLCGLSKDTVKTMIDTGGEMMRLDVFRKICAALQVSPSTILESIDPVDMPIPPPLFRRGRPKASEK